MATTPDEKRYVRTLATTVRVKLVEDQEPQVLRSTYQFAVFGARKQQFQHHVVGEQDVGRIAPDRLSFGSFLLPGVAGEAHGRLSFRVAFLKELPEFLCLAVRQGVHRVDHDRLNASPGPVAQNVVHDWHNVGHALTGAGAAGEDIGLAFLRLQDGFPLMSMKE